MKCSCNNPKPHYLCFHKRNEIMKAHEIELQELIKWHEETVSTFAYSSRERKSLVCSLKGGFRVIVNGEVVWEGMQPFSAVEAYNNITEEA